MTDFNPYEAPRVEVASWRPPASEDSGAWQSGKLLVMTKDAELPDRCVKCNLPANGLRLRRNLSWHPQGYYLLLLINVILYAIVALIVRKTAKIEVGICQKHRSRRRRAIAVGWLLPIVGIGLIVAGAVISIDPTTGIDFSAVGALSGILCIFAGILYGILGSQVTPPKKIDTRFVWLSQVSPDYLVQLPAWGERDLNVCRK